MTKINNQFNSLAQIKFVEDIDQETAANYSGGVGRINDGNKDPDIILYEDSDFQGLSIGINAAIGDGIPNVGAILNDRTSSFTILKGTWKLFIDEDYGGEITGGAITTDGVGPGIYNLFPEYNDTITSLTRVG